MAEDKKEHTSVLNINELDAKIAALQALREAMKAAQALGVLGPLIEGVGTFQAAANGDASGPIDLPEGAFNNKSVPACIELYLSSAPMKKRTNKEIVAALREGGVETNAGNFDTTVAAALFKLKQAGKVLRFKDGWGLTSWYPAHIRGSAPVPAKKQSGKKKRQKKSVSPAGTPSSKKAASVSPSQPNESVTAKPSVWKEAPEGASAQERIVDLLRSKPNTEFSGADVASALPDIKRNVIGLILGRLTDVRRKVAERTPAGNYRIVASNLHQMTAVS